MKDVGRGGIAIVDRQSVEPIEVALSTLGLDPPLCHPLDLPSLPPGDRLQGIAEARTSAALHLYKSYGSPSADDEIDLFTLKPDVAVEDSPTPSLQEFGRPCLVSLTRLVAVHF